MKLFRVRDNQCQYDVLDVQADTRAEARILYCNYYKINPLLTVDRLVVTLLESE